MTPLSAALKRFFRTPKGMLIALLVVVTAFAVVNEGLRLVAPGLAAGVLAAMLVDAPLLRWREGAWCVPDGALLTGLIVAMVLSPYGAWWIAAVTSATAIVSKYLLRMGKANVFNPAALALVITFYLFDTGHSWWGALADAPTWQLVVLGATGIFITDRVKKTPLVLSFLGSYYLLVTSMAFLGEPDGVAALYRAPDLNAALYFAFFMVTDPPTSPPRYRDHRGRRRGRDVRVHWRGLFPASGIAGGECVGSVPPVAGTSPGGEFGARARGSGLVAFRALFAVLPRVARWPLLRGGPSRLHASRSAVLLRVARYATRSTLRRAYARSA